MKVFTRILLIPVLAVAVSCLTARPDGVNAQEENAPDNQPEQKEKEKKQNQSENKEEKATNETDEPNEASAELSRLEKKLKKVKLQNELFQKKIEASLREIKSEYLKEKAKTDLLKEKQEHQKLRTKVETTSKEKQKKLQKLQNQIDELETEIKLAEKRTEKDLQDMKSKEKELSAELELQKTKRKHELAKLQLELEEKKLKQKLEVLNVELNKAKLQNRKLKRKINLADVHAKKSKMQADIQLRDTRSTWKKEVNQEIKYIQDPLRDDTLYLTDRRIKLNGPIVQQTGKWASKRINYFNNQSEKYPIFIVINDSPGGSVMAGLHILETMKSTEAPVYVVVKERAASMAAAIATLADRSFAFPDAVLLHHEIQASMGGSLTETEESLEMMKKWWRRLATPIAEKMDLTLEEFRNRLYEENSNGNWQEFASEAQELNWIDHVIKKIEDAGIRKEPKEEPPSPFFFFFKQQKGKNLKKDEQGQYYRKLPPLRPFDFYYMYDPTNFYRW